MVYLSEAWKNFFKVFGFIVLGIFVLFLIAIVLYPIIRKKFERNHFKDIYYRTINRIAYDNDWLLINNLTLKGRNGKICTIDHLLFAEKYIYAIRDRYYSGAVSGEVDDNVWYFYGAENKKEEMENPMTKNKERISKLAKIIHFDEEYFISIVLINNNSLVKNLKSLNVKKESFIVSVSKLNKLIKDLEKRDVATIDQKSLEAAVLEIAELKNRVIDDEIN